MSREVDRIFSRCRLSIQGHVVASFYTSIRLSLKNFDSASFGYSIDHDCACNRIPGRDFAAGKPCITCDSQLVADGETMVFANVDTDLIFALVLDNRAFMTNVLHEALREFGEYRIRRAFGFNRLGSRVSHATLQIDR